METPDISRKRQKRLILYFTLGAAFLFWLFTIRAGHQAGDFAMYVQHAVNLVEGNPYAASGYIRNPHAPSVGTTNYPPGVPVVLAAVYAVFGLNFTAMKVVLLTTFFLALLVFARTVEEHLPPLFYGILLVDLGFMPFLWEYKDRVESDFLFLLPLYGAVFLLTRGIVDEDSPPYRRFVVVGVLFYLAVATRTIGLALVPALLLFDLVDRRSLLPSQRFWIPTGALVVLMIAQAFLLPLESGGYGAAFLQQVQEPVDFLRSMILNAKFYILAVGRRILSNGYGNRWADALLLLSTIPLVLGFARRARRLEFTEIFLVVYTGVLLVWPFRQPNYFIPLIPLLSFYILYGSLWIADLAGGRTRLVGGLVLIIIAATYVPRYVSTGLRELPYNVRSADSKEAFEWLRSNAADEEVVLTRVPREVALFTGLRATPPVLTTDRRPRFDERETGLLLRWADSVGVDYVAAGPRGYGYHEEVLPLWNFVKERSDLFVPLYANDEWRIVRFDSTPHGD